MVRVICTESAHLLTPTASRQDLTKPQSHKARNTRSRDQPAPYKTTTAQSPRSRSDWFTPGPICQSMDANTDESDVRTSAARTKTWWRCALVRAICAESAHQRTRTTSRQDLTKPQSPRSEKNAIAGSTRSLRNNLSCPNQNLVS